MKFLCILMLCVGLGQQAYAQRVIDDGSYRGIEWRLTSDGTLTFVVGNIYAFKKPGEPTAVADVNVSNAVTSVVYYNAAGQQASTPFHGFNIVVSSRADGTKTVSKTLK